MTEAFAIVQDYRSDIGRGIKALATACLEREDVESDGGGNEYHCKFEAEPGKNEEHAMDGCEPKGGYGNDLYAQGDGLILTETFYVGTEAGMIHQPTVCAWRATEEHGGSQQKKGCGGQDRQEYADDTKNHGYEADGYIQILHDAKII